MDMIKLDALIIGAGPAGSTTAILLAKAGFTVGVVEKKAFPRRKVCGEFISATSLPLLKKLGLDNLYLAEAGPEIKRVALYAADSILTSNMPHIDASKTKSDTPSIKNKHIATNQWGRAYGREHLDTALLHAAASAGANVWQPANVQNLQQCAEGYTCLIKTDLNSVEISTTMIINAYGSWEKNKNLFSPHNDTKPQTSKSLSQHQLTRNVSKSSHDPSDLLAFKAHFTHANLAADLMPLLAFPGGYGGLVNTDNNRVTLSCCIRRDYLEKARIQFAGIQAGEAVLKHIMATTRGVHQTLNIASREGSWLAAGPIQPGIRQRYHKGVFFVGNIAGEAHPIVAEGISMAMQSAWVLSDELIKHKQDILNAKPSDRISILDKVGTSYSKKWYRHFSARIHAAAFFSRIAINPFATKIILILLKSFPRLLTFGAKLSGKIQKVVV